MSTKRYRDGLGGKPPYTAVGTYGDSHLPYVTTVHTNDGHKDAMKLVQDACAADIGTPVQEGFELRLVALFHGEPELVDLDREQYECEEIVVLAPRILRGFKGRYDVALEHTGGGIVVCQVFDPDDEGAAYAWITDSGKTAAPFRIGVYFPGQEEHVSLETVGVQELVHAVQRGLERAEEQRNAGERQSR